MKKIINGKMYNTETATKLGDFWNGLSKSDSMRTNTLKFSENPKNSIKKRSPVS